MLKLKGIVVSPEPKLKRSDDTVYIYGTVIVGEGYNTEQYKFCAQAWSGRSDYGIPTNDEGDGNISRLHILGANVKGWYPGHPSTVIHYERGWDTVASNEWRVLARQLCEKLETLMGEMRAAKAATEAK